MTSKDLSEGAFPQRLTKPGAWVPCCQGSWRQSLAKPPKAHAQAFFLSYPPTTTEPTNSPVTNKMMAKMVSPSAVSAAVAGGRGGALCWGLAGKARGRPLSSIGSPDVDFNFLKLQPNAEQDCWKPEMWMRLGSDPRAFKPLGPLRATLARPIAMRRAHSRQSWSHYVFFLVMRANYMHASSTVAPRSGVWICFKNSKMLHPIVDHDPDAIAPGPGGDFCGSTTPPPTGVWQGAGQELHYIPRRLRGRSYTFGCKQWIDTTVHVASHRLPPPCSGIVSCMNGSGRCQQHGPAGVALRAHIASGSSRAILRHSRLVTWRPGGLSRARLAKRVPLAHDQGVADGPRRVLPENLPAKREIYLIRSDGTSCTREFVQGRLVVGWVSLCVGG